MCFLAGLIVNLFLIMPSNYECVLKWLLEFNRNDLVIDITDLKILVDSLGFSTTLTTTDNDSVCLQITNPDANQSKAKMQNNIKDQSQKKMLVDKSPTEESISVTLPTSSPVIQQQDGAIEALNKIIDVAKNALQSLQKGNVTFTKPPFVHRRISDIHPQAIEEAHKETNSPELNITTTRKSPLILKSPAVQRAEGGASKTKDEADEARHVPTPRGRTLLQTIQSKIPSKLRTPTATGCKTSPNVRSGGRIPQLVDRKPASTNSITPRRDVPSGVTRFKQQLSKRP